MAELDVVVNARGAQAGARVAQSALEQIRRTAQGLAAGLYTLERGLSTIWNQTDKAASFEESWQRLTIQTRNYHSTAQLVINDLKAVTNGQLSLADATQLASRGLAEGLSPDHLKTFATAADALADVMGTDLKQGFDTILQGLATGRTQALANIGVYVDLDKEVKQLAVSTNRTTDQITKQEKAMIAANAVTRQLDTALGKMADDSVSEADKLKAIEARFDDMTLSVGRFSKSLVVATADFFKMLEAMRHDTSINPFAAANQALRQATPGHMESPGFQEILGRSIVSDTQGNLRRRAEDEAKRRKSAANMPLDPKLRALEINGAAERMRAQIEAESASLISGTQHQSRLFGLDQQAGQQGVGAGVGAEAFLKAQQDAKLKELAIAGETQNKLLQLEGETYKKRVALGFESTQEKFQFEEAYKTKVQSINSEIAKIVQDFSNVERESEAERTVLRGQLQEQLGQRITDGLISQFQVGEDLRHRAQDDTQAYYQNLLKFQEAYGTSRENMMTTEYDLVRANLAKQLDVNQETAEKVLNAWRNSDHTLAEELIGNTKLTADQIRNIWLGSMADQREISKKYSDDFFSGFGESMHKYVNDQSVFGLGIDQARRVAQGMEQAFGKFFFDTMEGRIQSFKDVVQGVTDFAKNLVADISSKLITRSVLSGVDALMSGGGGSIGGLAGGAGNVGGFALRGHARGGISSVPAIFGEAGPEAAVPLPDGRSIPVKWTGGPYSMPAQSTPPPASTSVNVQVVNNTGADVEVSQGPMKADGTQDIEILINNTVKKGMRNGVFDQSMKKFGANRTPARR